MPANPAQPAMPAEPATPAEPAMPAMPVRRRRRTTALAAAVATAAALGVTALTGATTASAAEVPLTGYELTWGIKQSYRSYVTGMAKGTFTPSGGATQAEGNGPFTFVDGSGSYDASKHTVALAFRGTLAIESEAHGFELALSDVRFDSGAARITADVTTGGTTRDDVPLAKVTVTRAMKDMQTELTKEAAEVFGSASYEGAAGDPLTVVQKTPPKPDPKPTAGDPTEPSSPKPGPTATASPTKNPSPTATASTSASASVSASASASASQPAGAPVAKGEIADGTLGWGVKQSFRAYVVGPVAKGRITTSGGATQSSGNGAFTFRDASGTYDTSKGRLKAAFQGAVNFKGHEENGSYGLDLTLTGLEVTLNGGTGKLTADVTSLGEAAKDVVLADLKAKSRKLTAKDGVITVNDITATLTAAGAKAFGDFYTAGTALDPVDVSVAVSDDAVLPGGTGGSGPGTGGTGQDGGSGTGGSTTGGTGSTTGGVTGALASTGSGVPVAALGTAAALTVAAGAGVVLALRRRQTAAEGTAAE